MHGLKRVSKFFLTPTARTATTFFFETMYACVATICRGSKRVPTLMHIYRKLHRRTFEAVRLGMEWVPSEYTWINHMVHCCTSFFRWSNDLIHFKKFLVGHLPKIEETCT
jgi:hypothetical protein